MLDLVWGLVRDVGSSEGCWILSSCLGSSQARDVGSCLGIWDLEWDLLCGLQ